MKEAQIPNNESERQANLDSYNLVDTPPEVDFDYITELASQLCKTPIALISIIDNDRQWFKSKVGLGADQTGRDISFCGHAIHSDELFEIKDSNKDERFKDNPLVTDAPHVIFYAGQPIISSEGHKLGTLCVIDNKPNELNDEQKRSLFILAQHIRSLLDLRKRNVDLQKALIDVESKSTEMIHNSKLVSLGRLAGGVAHEINNPLAIIGGRVDQLNFKLKLEKDSKEQQLIESIKENVKRIKGIVTGMLEFSRDEKSATNETTTIAECVDMVYPFFSEKCASLGVGISCEIEDDLVVDVNKIQISQIFVNLLNNALDATEGQTKRKVSIVAKKEEDKVVIRISDNGPGIPEEHIEKVLEPFFSTKPTGKGTGLGLSISFGMAKTNGGTLGISRGRETGAEFFLQLPSV
jgi:signal transduction histidine kinase